MKCRYSASSVLYLRFMPDPRRWRRAAATAAGGTLGAGIAYVTKSPAVSVGFFSASAVLTAVTVWTYRHARPVSRRVSVRRHTGPVVGPAEGWEDSGGHVTVREE
jgi:hypothetical protein